MITKLYIEVFEIGVVNIYKHSNHRPCSVIHLQLHPVALRGEVHPFMISIVIVHTMTPFSAVIASNLTFIPHSLTNVETLDSKISRSDLSLYEKKRNNPAISNLNDPEHFNSLSEEPMLMRKRLGRLVVSDGVGSIVDPIVHLLCLVE